MVFENELLSRILPTTCFLFFASLCTSRVFLHLHHQIYDQKQADFPSNLL